MPVVFRRSLFFGEQDGQTIEQLYESLRQDLQTQVAERLGLLNHPEMFNNWPNSTWSNVYGSATAECSEWVPEASSNQRLLQLKVIECHQACEWILALALGKNGEELVIYEESSISPSRPVIPFETMPEMLTFIGDYPCQDEDGMRAGRIYLVSSDRADAFADFVSSAERRLPLVLISPTRSSSNYLLTYAGALARRMQGLAHVIRLEDDQSAQRFRSRHPNHACYDGAVRLFWPGFRTTDNPGLHPFWPPRQLRTTEDVAIISEGMFASVAKESIRISEENPDIKFLRQQHSEQETRERLAQAETQIKEQLRLRLQEQADAQLEELICEYDELEHERNRLRKENEFLSKELAIQQHKVRVQRWQLNSAWQGGQQVELDDSRTVTPTILLSSKARKQYDSLDSQERNYWDQHILRKLADEDLRNNQTEPMEGSKGTCWVYPRSRTAGGRRLLYYCEGTSICICQLFTGGEHDGEYERLRSEGVARDAYHGYREWQQESILGE